MPNYQRAAIHSADDIRAIADHAGSYFFSADTMRLFSSRLLSAARPLDGADTVEGRRYLFVTSERHGDDAPRHYALRMLTLEATEDGRPSVDIHTVGDHHATRAMALAAMRNYV